MADFGQLKGDTCWRNGCQGVIAEYEVENCSCHINPPCGACTTDRAYCSSCDWQASDEVEKWNDLVCKINPADRNGTWLSVEPRPLDPRKIDWRSKSHTHSSMIKEGVYPEGTERAEVEKLVRGTFGGRFEHFRDGRFKYVAYTD